MTKNNIEEKLSLVPLKPGCYLMKDKHGQVIYVGKSKQLRNRVRSYFKGAHDQKTQRLVMEIADFEYIVTSSEIDARSEEHTSELQSRGHLVCRLLLEKKKKSR